MGSVKSDKQSVSILKPETGHTHGSDQSKINALEFKNCFKNKLGKQLNFIDTAEQVKYHKYYCFYLASIRLFFNYVLYILI